MEKTYFLILIFSFLNMSAQEEVNQLHIFFNELHKEGKFNGNVLIAEKGEIIFKESYGLANEETKQKLNEETVFELASLSKQFTAMGIVQLEKEGRLSYNDTISKYIPELKIYKGVTIHNLLTHTGGLPDYMGLAEDYWDKTKIATNDDIISLLEKIKPKMEFEPNKKWDYSNTGYLLLGTIIERVSGKSFEEYLKEKIFSPIGMNNTTIYRRRFLPKKMQNYALGYIFSDSLQRKILPDELGNDFYVVYLDGIVGDGMVNSNIHDLLLWDRALYNNSFIDNNDRKLIFSSYKTDENEETDYGYGWFLADNDIYGKIAYHTGSWAGYLTFIDRHLDNDKTIIILQNNSNKETKIPIKNVRRILYDLPVEKPIILEDDLLLKYKGIYITDKGKEKEIVFEDNKLWIPMNPQVKLELVPVSKTKFIVSGFSPEVSYTFILDKNSEVIGYRVQQPEQGVDQITKRKITQ
ncbi:class A beta-lactamase-related serine hydrolase [Flavobacterium piscinae]|uniref:Class A beta-lactamase-related serine hydrolase n=2 Tax=Flavobacterium piscinae TaxID=2506424 RepID=A0A4Q1KWU7_9FLAO|nr:class A beta-lactamase-related serine hydrolase [Flavobacterium piscinae]